MSGIILWVELEQEIPGLPEPVSRNDPYLNDSGMQAMDAIASQLGVTPLKNFRAAAWSPAADGLTTIRALIAYLEQNPSADLAARLSLATLRYWERLLFAAQSAGVKWMIEVELA